MFKPSSFVLQSCMHRNFTL